MSLHGRPASELLTPDERDTYNRALRERNDFGQAAGIAGGVAAVLLATGLGLFVLDEPEVAIPSVLPGGKPLPAPRPTFEVGLGSMAVKVAF